MKISLQREETRNVKTGKGVRQECCLSPVLFNLHSDYLTKQAVQGFGDYRVGGQVFRTVKYADDLVLQAKAGAVLQGMVERLIETERYYGMERKGKERNIVNLKRRESQDNYPQFKL
jgi:hypothetical protein